MRWYWYVLISIFLLSLIIPDAGELDSDTSTIEGSRELPKQLQSSTNGKVPDEVMGALKTEVLKPNQASTVNLYVTGNSVNQRDGPSIGHKVLGKLYMGNSVTKLSESGGWTQITSSKGQGWISSNYVSEVYPKPDAKRKTQTSKRSVALPTSRDEQTARKQIIKQSIASYSGSCPCPYNRDRAGRRCGKRSAWSRPGGYSPICYDSDVSQSRLASYFARKRGAAN